jgi:hypothetical protein
VAALQTIVRAHLALFICCTFAWFSVLAAERPDFAANVASLIAREKLITLRTRAINPRLQKCVYWLEKARLAGLNPTNTTKAAVSTAGYRGLAAALTE